MISVIGVMTYIDYLLVSGIFSPSEPADVFTRMLEEVEKDRFSDGEKRSIFGGFEIISESFRRIIKPSEKPGETFRPSTFRMAGKPMTAKDKFTQEKPKLIPPIIEISKGEAPFTPTKMQSQQILKHKELIVGTLKNYLESKFDKILKKFYHISKFYINILILTHTNYILGHYL